MTALRLDALVCLMPGDARFGAAVVVPAQDAVSHVVLPELNETKVRQVGARIDLLSRDLARARRLDLGRRRDLSAESASSLDEVCRWAWTAAIGPLIDRHLTIPADRPLRWH